MPPEMVAPAWMHSQISAEQYDSWSDEQCAGIEIVDGMAVVSPSASKQRNRLARILANALDAAAGPDWNVDTDFDVRLQEVPLTNRGPDVIAYRAETIDLTPRREARARVGAAPPRTPPGTAPTSRQGCQQAATSTGRRHQPGGSPCGQHRLREPRNRN